MIARWSLRASCWLAPIAAGLAHGCGSLSFPDVTANDGGNDSSLVDALHERDSGFEDQSSPSPQSCAPIDASWEAATPQPIARTDACRSAEEVIWVIECLYDAPDGRDCATGLPLAASCARCLTGGADGGGPIELTGRIARVDVASCLVTLNPQAAAVAKLVANDDACATAACAQCSGVGLAAYGACLDVARLTTCATEHAVAQKALDGVAGPDRLAAPCHPGGPFLEAAERYATLFCRADAGVD